MTLAVLLSAQLPSVDGRGDGLAALLPLAGMTLIERQAEDAAAVGADRLLVLVDAVPADLTAAMDRIRARGMAVRIVRDGAAVIAASDGATRLMLVADGLIAPRSLWETLAGSTAPRLLSVSDTPATAALERIDAQRRWAGLAVVDADAVTALADLPEDWDPQLALLRGAIQTGAPAIACEPQLFERGDVAQLDRAATADVVEQRLLAHGSDRATGLVFANLAMPLTRAGARLLLQGTHGGLITRLLAVAGAVAAIMAIWAGLPLVAALLALFGQLARAAAATIAAFRPETGWTRWLEPAGDMAAAAALLAAGWAATSATSAHDSIWLMLGAAMVLLIQLGRLLADRGAARAALVWDDGSSWLLIGLAALAGPWSMGLAASVPLAAAAALLAVWKTNAAKAV